MPSTCSPQKFSLKNKEVKDEEAKPGMGCRCHPSVQEVVTGGSKLRGQPAHIASSCFKKTFLLLKDDVGSGDLRQMSEYPISHGCSYILRRWRPAFLHPKGEIQVCHRADEQNVLTIVPFPQ
jgi:hypothetical protein